MSLLFVASCKKDKFVESVTLNKTTLELKVGKTATLTVTVSPADAVDKTVSWTSSDAGVATVDANGKVTAVKAGKATITVTTTDGNKTATCEVTVTTALEEMEMVFVQGGTFTMGSPDSVGFDDEHPQHQVTLSDFYISKYEVTNAQYTKFLNAKGMHEDGGNAWLDLSDSDCQIELVGGEYKVKSGKENYPVIFVTWYGATAYAEWKGGRLPTEAEWEYAARGGNQSQGYTYSGSNNIDDVAWYRDNSTNPDNDLYNGKGTHIVGTKQANELGIYDMTGNVCEWCSDWYGDYTADAQTNPTGATSGSYRVYRGGSWSYGAFNCRVAFRGNDRPSFSYYNLGFRVVVL